MSTKINRLEIENVKRVKAVAMEPPASGLTIVGGKNGQGKTSVLDAIAWALGGEKFRPSEPRRDGSVLPPSLRLELSNGFVVERKGKNSELKVIDPNGNKAGQQILNEFVEQLALNLPKFMQSGSKEKAETLLRIIGVGEKLYELESRERQLYSRRLEIGRIADQKKKHAAELITYPEAPAEPVSASELIRQQQEILARNGENQRKRRNLTALRNEHSRLSEQLRELRERLKKLEAEEDALFKEIEAAKKTADELRDESTAELEENIAEIDLVNQKARSNMDKEKAETEAEEYSQQYNDLTAEIDAVKKEKTDLLTAADLPLPGLSVEDGELTYKGYRWDNMSGAEQLKVATAIVRKLNPSCGFVLLDKLEQMDADTLAEFGSWLEAEGLQAIATRVSTGDECSIVIEDGYGGDVKNDLKLMTDFCDRAVKHEAEAMPEQASWKAGEF